MIGYLRGRILDVSLDGRAVVGVGGESPSIGYQVLLPSSPAYVHCVPGAEVELFVHTHVREDALDLFGFRNRDEKDFFLTLMTVNGIGPKAALGLLSKIDPEDLIDAILRGDVDALVKVPGIGKKTAERVIVELTDSLKKKVEHGAFAAWTRNRTTPNPATALSSSRRVPLSRQASHSPAGIPGEALEVYADARDALIGLGYRDAEILTALQKVLTVGELARAGVPTPETAVRGALRQLMTQR